MLSHPNRVIAARWLQELGLDDAVLNGPHRAAELIRLGRLPVEAPYSTALVAWLLDRGEPGDEPVMDRALRWSRALLLSNADQDALCRSLAIHETLSATWAGLGIAAQKRVAAQAEFEQALAVLEAAEPEAAGGVRRRVQELVRTGLSPSPLITGDDLIDLGLAPGPSFRGVLDAVYDAQLEGGLRDRDEALALARAIAETDGSCP